ncbi:hypothetical protein PAEPH01_0264 [Pancytospora epiphaga]|nr:hypothetical protein PAEPH01_0264 [Pancytospora epiphaga]
MENYKALHEKFIKITTGVTPERFIEVISRIENRLSITSELENIAIVPLEANFQLPNVFLNTRRINKVEKLFSDHGSDENQREKIDQIIGWLDNIQFEYEEEQRVSPEGDKHILSALLKYRYN